MTRAIASVSRLTRPSTAVRTRSSARPPISSRRVFSCSRSALKRRVVVSDISNCEYLPGSGMRDPGSVYLLLETRAPRPRTQRSANERTAKPRVLSKTPGDVVFRELLGRIREDALGRRVLHELAQPEERRVIRYAGRLLHVVRDDHNRIFRLQLVHELFDSLGGDWVQR